MPTSLPARPAAPVTSSAAVPAQVAAPSSKIVVRSFTAADAARSNPARAATQPTISAPDSVLAAVPMAAPALTNAKRTLDTITSEVAPRRSHRSTEASSPSTAQVVCSGATLRARPGRGSSAMNNFGRGTTVTVLGREADWTHVRVNGQEGYIFSSLLSSGGGTSVATTTQPQPAASSSSRSRRRARRDESVAVADAKPRASSRRQVATTEPILVP
jgi:SH3-like domain-containing protein